MATFPGDGIPNVLSARDFIMQWYGALATTRPHETDYTIGTTPVALGSTFGQRLAFIVSNTGGVNIAVSFKDSVTITTGILLTQGAAFGSTWLNDLEVVGRPLWAVAASAGATVHMIENILAGA